MIVPNANYYIECIWVLQPKQGGVEKGSAFQHVPLVYSILENSIYMICILIVYNQQQHVVGIFFKLSPNCSGLPDPEIGGFQSIEFSAVFLNQQFQRIFI